MDVIIEMSSLYDNMPTASLAPLKYYPDENRQASPTIHRLTELLLNL